MCECFPLEFIMFFLCKSSMSTKVQYASVKSQKYLLTLKWFAEEVSHSPQPVIVQDRRANPLLKSSQGVCVSAISTCTAERHNYFYHISGACAALTHGDVSLLLSSSASQSHMYVTRAKHNIPVQL